MPRCEDCENFILYFASNNEKLSGSCLIHSGEIDNPEEYSCDDFKKIKKLSGWDSDD